MKKKVVIDGVAHELDLTPEQLAIVSKPKLPVSWEEVYEIDAPDWCVKCDGVVVDDMAGYVGMDKMNIASKARGKSLAAYAKLSVVVDYFNSITKRYVDLYTIEYDIENESLFVATYTSYLVNPLVINDKEIAEHILKHFKELLHEYLMTGK